MENVNHPAYGFHNTGGSYFPQQQPLYPPSQGTYPTPTPPPPVLPYQQPPSSGPSPQGYFTNTNQPPPPTGGYGQPGMPSTQPPYTASYQQPGSQYQGQPSYSECSPQSTGNFDPRAPQYSQQLSPPQNFGYPPPGPPASSGYNPQNPPPLPPRSPAAQMSFAPPPVTAISSKPTGTLGRLGAKVAGTVQSKVKDYLAARQENIQPASLGLQPLGTHSAFGPSYGYNQPSQPWPAPSVGPSNYPVSPVPSASSEYQTAPGPHSQNINQATSLTTSPDSHSSHGPTSNVSMPTAVSPPIISAPGPPAPSISSSAQPQASDPTPFMPAPSTSPQPPKASHTESKPTDLPFVPQTESPIAQPTSTIEVPRPVQVDQASEQGQQASHTSSTNPSMTWGWNLTFNPASQSLGQFVPHLNLTPMFTAPSPNQPVSESAAQTAAPTPSTEALDHPEPSRQQPPSNTHTSHQTVLAELPADQAPRIPEKLPVQAVSQSLGSSSDQTSPSESKSAGFQPYRPTVLAQGSDGNPSPAKQAAHSSPRPLNSSNSPENGNRKPIPKPASKTFQPYRAPETRSEQKRDSNQLSGAQSSPIKPTTANQTVSIPTSGPTVSKTSATATPSEAQPKAEPPRPLVSSSTSGQEAQVSTNATSNSITALGDLITNYIQNLAISSTPPATYSPAASNPRQNGSNRGSLESVYHDEYCPYPMLTTPMRAHGRSAASSDSSNPEPSRFCFGAAPARFPRSYYRHPQALSFPICTWCFSAYIAHTSLASAFPESLVVRAANVVCGFHVPRITKCLWPAAVKSGDLTELVQFMEKRYPTLPTASADPNDAKTTTPSEPAELTLIKPCKRGGQPVYAHEGYKWYRASTPSPLAPDLIVCEACYEDLILATPAFAAHFAGPFPQPESEILACTMGAHAFLERALFRYGGATADWEGFIQAANMRLELTQSGPTKSCNGLSRSVTSCRWWTLKGYENVIPSLPSEAMGSFFRTHASKHFIICESCYLDAVVGTRFESTFAMVAEPPLEQISMWDTERYHLQRWCTYSSGKNHAIADAFLAAHMRKLSPQTLHSMLEEIASKPRCTQLPSGIHDGLFYNFPGAERVDDFGICEGHYASTVKGFGLEQSFSKSPVQVPGQAYCAFHPAVLRAEQWIQKLNETIDTGDFTIYQENVRKFVAIPFCPRREAVEHRRWYGWPDCAICPDCFEQFAAGTKLVEDMPWKNELAEYLVICSMYSPRQRDLYSQTCESGDVEGLLAACRERIKIWNRTVPRMTVLAAQKCISNGQAMLAAQLAHSHATSNAISFGDDGTRWTTSSGNTYQSYNGVLAEKYRNEAEALDAKLRGLDPTSESTHLAVLWESVE